MAKQKVLSKQVNGGEKSPDLSLYTTPARILQDHEKRELFRVFWAENRNKYGKNKNLEEILWVHIKSMKLDDPSKFSQGLEHFGLKKVR